MEENSDITSSTKPVTQATLHMLNCADLSKFEFMRPGNTSSNCTEYNDFNNKDDHSFLTLIFGCMDLINVLGSIVVIMLIVKASRLKDSPSLLLMNNTIADCIFGLSFIAETLLYMIISDVNLLKILTFAQRILASVILSESIHSLTMILFTFHLAICKPIYYKLYWRSSYTLIFLSVSWLANTFLSSSVLFVDGVIDMETIGSANVMFQVSKYKMVYVTVDFLLKLIIPLIIIVVCYVRISLMQRTSDHTMISSQSTTKAYIQQAKGVLFMAMAFLCTLALMFIIDLLPHLISSSKSFDEILFVLLMSFYGLNYLYFVLKLPLILYAFKSYRRIFKAWFCSCVCKGDNSTAEVPATGSG